MRYRNLLIMILLFSCSKENNIPPVTNPPKTVSVKNAYIDNLLFTTVAYAIGSAPSIKIQFSGPVKQTTAAASISMTDANGINTPVDIRFLFDSVMIVKPASTLKFLTKYNFSLSTALQSASGGKLNAAFNQSFFTYIDSSSKFPTITDDQLLTKVQQQIFKYFWDFGHPVSGLARERSNGDNDVVTSGGSGFGIMTIPVAINRNFITRAEGLERMQKIVGFLKNTAVKVKGAFPHWLNGSTGAIIAFSPNDDGADLVETSYLMAGLLTARQYFNGTDANETALRSDINILWNGVEWDWFRNGGQDVLYWHYSASKQWIMNFPIKGWNECLITYIMASASTTHSVPVAVYSNGWASGNNFSNGNSYFGYQLPLGPPQGGPLFFSHYSFLGVNPNGLQDAYANYTTQTKNHTLINYKYCVANPGNGYSADCWGLTASDIKNGYNASSPTSDVGVIAPTAALSSLPYTPAESMKAMKFYYYVLGDKIWKEYGFVDAFSLKQEPWFAESFLAIDQGPIMVMIENYRTGLIWDLLTGCPEVKAGMKALGFTAPYL